MKPLANPFEAATTLGIPSTAISSFGNFAVKIDHQVAQLGFAERSILIDVTAITPTTAGEGKTTSLIGLVDALRIRGKNAVGTIRQSSSGPTFNMKGAGVGGGKSECVPRIPLILGLTGDFDRVAQAQNLGMTALTARMIHEAMYDDKKLCERGIRRLNIDGRQLNQSWTIDLCSQGLRNIELSLESRPGSLQMVKSGFVMSAATEVMTIFSLARSLPELRSMLGQMEFAKDIQGNSVTGDDLQVAGAMAVIMQHAMNPNLVLTAGGSPIFMHGGPFANISVGNSTIVADAIAGSFADMVVTESGFGTDVGFEKMWNIKAQRSGFHPHVAVIVVTAKALKALGTAVLGDTPTSTGSLNLEAGLANLERHIAITRRAGAIPVVCINKFAGDIPEDLSRIASFCAARDVNAAVSDHFSQGGDGALELADLVIEATGRKPRQPLPPLYRPTDAPKSKISTIVTDIYGFARTSFSSQFELALERQASVRNLDNYDICMCKTPYSFSEDPKYHGDDTDRPFEVTDLVCHHGAKLLIPVCGKANFMPGTVSNPLFKNIDIDLDTGAPIGI